MELCSKKSRGSALNVLFFSSLIFIFFYIFNVYTPLFVDDYSYSFSFLTGERIDSF